MRSWHEWRTQDLTAKQVSESHRTAWFENPSFARMIEIHDQYKGEFVRWRQLFAEHAAELAILLKTFPGSEKLREEKLRRIIAGVENKGAGLPQRKIFGPWTNHWSGRWSNGRLQYHIWDSTRFSNGQWIQPVSLSETGFAGANSVEVMTQNRRTDVAINVVSTSNGITGWVSKRQRRQAELPHLGYLIDDTTLVWICQIKDPENLFERDSRWFVYLEAVHISHEPLAYSIYGLSIVLTDKILVDVRERGKHWGTYYARDSGKPRGA